MNRATPKRAKQLRQYAKLRKVFLSENNKVCERCCGPSEDVHHFYGRTGELLCYVPGFRAVCKACHRWIETHRKEAIRCGWRADERLFNRPSLVIPK